MMTMSKILFALVAISSLLVLTDAITCPVTSSTTVVYNSDTANGVGVASKTWIANLFSWWATGGSTINVMALTAVQIQACNLASYTNLRLFIQPGGNTYAQLSGLGATGVANIIAFINRNQVNPSAYAGMCAGGYGGAHDYIWTTMFEGVAYFNSFGTPPPMSFFPHTVEGSIIDLNDDQFGSYVSTGTVKYRYVNVSNSQRMLYYGGSTFGWNGVPDYADPSNAEYDSKVTVLTYFQDVYGYNTVNVPAVWTYNGNILLTSVHPEADGSTCSDCPVAGTISSNDYLQNRAWLATYLNQIGQTTFTVPSVPVASVFNTAKPHTAYPTLPCYSGTNLLFCDSFMVPSAGTLYPGMFQWQRNQTDYNHAWPWNVTFTGTMMGQTTYGVGQGGSSDGWAVSIPNTGTANPDSTITSKSFSTVGQTGVTLAYYYKGKTLAGGYFKVDYTTNGGTSWTTLRNANLYGTNAKTVWTSESWALPVGNAVLQIRFSCNAGSAVTNYCGVDTVTVTHA
jgi:glutamine amidotransferase-like uncharacterized protein